MGRPFYVYEAEDPDLELLVSDFLDRKPDYRPMAGQDDSLVLVPYDDDWERIEDFCTWPEEAEAGEVKSMRPARGELLM